MKALAKMYGGQYRAIEDAAETWKADHKEAMEVYDLEKMIRSALWLNAAISEFVEAAFDAGSRGVMHDAEDVGKCILIVLDIACKTWETISKNTGEAVSKGYAVAGSEKIADSLAASKSLAADFAARWPFIRREDIDRGVTEIATGKFVTGEELLRDLQNPGG